MRPIAGSSTSSGGRPKISSVARRASGVAYDSTRTATTRCTPRRYGNGDEAERPGARGEPHGDVQLTLGPRIARLPLLGLRGTVVLDREVDRDLVALLHFGEGVRREVKLHRAFRGLDIDPPLLGVDLRHLAIHAVLALHVAHR